MFRLRGRSNRIALIRIDGVISDGEGLGSGRAKIVSALKEAERKRAKAVVVRINSPGGSIAACQEIFAALQRLRRKRIPVVASLGDVAASGGIYVSMAAEEIFASPGTVTGSIGVIIRSTNLSDLYEKIGVSAKVVKSGPHKDMLATYRPLSPDEQALLQEVIDDGHNQFVDAVATARNRPRSDVAGIADGRILTGRQALEAGLVDCLGDLDSAVERAAALAGIEGKPRLLVLGPRRTLLQRLLRPLGAGESVPVGVPLWLMPTR